MLPKHPILICNIYACLFENKFIKHLGLKRKRKISTLSIHYSSSSTGGKSTALIKCCIFQMNKNRFRIPGGQHKSLSKSPYSQHQLHHLQGSQFFFFFLLGWQFAEEHLDVQPGACCPSSDISASRQQRYHRSRGQPPPSLLPLSWAFPRRCRVGSLHVTGAAALLLSPPALPLCCSCSPSCLQRTRS